MSTLPRQILIGLALVVALVVYYLVTEHRIAAAELRATTAEAGEQAFESQLAQAKTSEKIVTQFVDRVQVVHDVGATITKKVPVYVTAHDDAACTLPLGFVRLHDAAAASTDLPDTAGAADAAPSGLALSTVAGTVVDNYTSCHATAQQLISLQGWVKANLDPAPAQ